MRLIGYWIESLRDTDYYPPQEFVGDWPPEVRARVADYLDGGQVFKARRGRSWCRFFCDHPMGNRELTDGHWVWPKDLSHYVRDHGVMIPSEIVCHIEARPAPIPKEQWEKSLPDARYWKAWCCQHSSGKYVPKLTAARQRADCEAERVFADAVAKLEASSGRSEATCRWAGCRNLALVGNAFCAHCTLKGQRDQIVSEVYHELRPILLDAEFQ